jgi:hypothetical protein
MVLQFCRTLDDLLANRSFSELEVEEQVKRLNMKLSTLLSHCRMEINTRCTTLVTTQIYCSVPRDESLSSHESASRRAKCYEMSHQVVFLPGP